MTYFVHLCHTNPFFFKRWVCHVFLLTWCLTPPPLVDTPVIKANPNSLAVIHLRQDQRLEKGGRILSQTGHVTLIFHAWSIAKAHIHPCGSHNDQDEARRQLSCHPVVNIVKRCSEKAIRHSKTSISTPGSLRTSGWWWTPCPHVKWCLWTSGIQPAWDSAVRYKLKSSQKSNSWEWLDFHARWIELEPEFRNTLTVWIIGVFAFLLRVTREDLYLFNVYPTVIHLTHTHTEPVIPDMFIQKLDFKKKSLRTLSMLGDPPTPTSSAYIPRSLLVLLNPGEVSILGTKLLLGPSGLSVPLCSVFLGLDQFTACS